MNWILSIHWALVASVWYFGNGLLHDAFVLTKHKGKYDRELLRLLMDGHVLMLSGAVVFVCWLMMLNKIQCGGLHQHHCSGLYGAVLCFDLSLFEINCHHHYQRTTDHRFHKGDDRFS